MYADSHCDKAQCFEQIKNWYVFSPLTMGWGKIEVTVSFIQVGFFPIYNSRDMLLQRKSLLF